MSADVVKSRKHNWVMMLPLAGILMAVYAFTYSGQIESGDTKALFNATASIVDYGDVLLDKSAADTPPPIDTAPAKYPLASVEVEPLQLVLSAPLYWLAAHIPGIGLVHAVWFFNILVGTATALVLYAYALTLGYRPFVAVVAALALGLGTLLWPYSRTFFREPLAGLLILLTAMSLERWRALRYRSILFFVLSISLLVGAFLTKEAVVFALPALVIIFVPAVRVPKWIIQFVLALFLLVIAVLLISTIAANLIAFTPVYAILASILHRSPQQVATMHLAFHSYLLSVGGSVWGTSPVLLLAIPGLALLYRDKRYRYPLSLMAVLLGFVLGYAFLRGDHWFGGLSWPSRFLIPAVPILMLGTLPMWDRVLRRSVRWWLAVGASLVCIYSVWVQLSAVSFDWGTYINLLPPEANGLIEWGGGLNDLRYLRWVLIPKTWGSIPFDFAWVRVGVMAWPVVCIGVVGVNVFWLFRLFAEQSTERRMVLVRRIMPIVLYSVSLLALVGLGLRAINTDVVYAGGNSALRSILPILQANTALGDVLLLADNEYETFFLNHGKLPLPRVVSLPDAPGEQPNADQPAIVQSTNPDALLVKSSVPLIHNLAYNHPTLWLLADFGPWHPWAVRPVERFLVTHYYPIRELTSDPPDSRIRLIEYSTVAAPDPFALRGADQLANLKFGDAIRLSGFTLPSGTSYQAGDVLPLSLYWRTDTALTHDYTVAYFLADASGNVVAQGADSPPAWGFAPTSGWKAGVPQWDNRALRLPPDLASGNYQIWLRLYQSDNRDILLPVSGNTVYDSTLGVLPVDIRVSP